MKQKVEQLIRESLDTLKHSSIVPQDLELTIQVNPSKNKVHGDFATNLPLMFAKVCSQTPKAFAELIIKHLPPHQDVLRVEIAEPGFINFFMRQEAKTEIIAEVLKQGDFSGYGKPSTMTGHCTSIQYAHARISSLFRQLQEAGISWNEAEGLQHVAELEALEEITLLALINRYPEVQTFSEPDKLVHYLYELATSLHSYYNTVQLLSEQESLSSARLCLLKAVRQILRNGLQRINLSTPESM